LKQKPTCGCFKRLEEQMAKKLKIYGPSNLSNEELVQIMLGCGIKGQPVSRIARRTLRFIDEIVLSDYRENYTEFLRTLTSIKGVGDQKASLIAASLELCARMLERQNHAVHDAGDVLPLISSLSTKKQEYFVCITLNGGNRIISKRIVTIGLLDQALVHPREVFADAIKERAAKIIVAHNHPAGDTSPSKEDIKVTENLAKASSILGLEFLDHVIVTQNGYFSFREEGFL
jgi:DNA repair protein RadC